MNDLPLTRQKIEDRERRTLAPYASFAADSLGRSYPQPEHSLRTAYQRDRDRIVHSAAFRRMEYKTQVFIPHEQDHYRTRLTHTIEVSQISRTLARNLQLNEDLAEAVALVHDLGHTPFGHSGEHVLDRLLAGHGGFNHNRQSLRVVDILEQRYPEHPGLNLSYEVREGIVKHETTVSIDLPEFAASRLPTLEASLVDVADEIAYNAHDIDDGLSSGILSDDDIRESEWFDRLGEGFVPSFEKASLDYRRYVLVRHLINIMAIDVIRETATRLANHAITGLAQVRRSERKLVGYSDTTQSLVDQLKDFLLRRLYRHSHLQESSRRACDIIELIYERLMADPSLMPKRFQLMLVDQPAAVVIADYIAGMTDRYAENIFRELSG